MSIRFLKTHDFTIATIFDQLQLDSNGLVGANRSVRTIKRGYQTVDVVTTPRIRTIKEGTYATKSPGGRQSRIPCVHGLRHLIEELLKAGITAFEIFEADHERAQDKELDELLGRTCSCIINSPLLPKNLVPLVNKEQLADHLSFFPEHEVHRYDNYYTNRVPDDDKKLQNPADWVNTHGAVKIIVGYRFYHINKWPEAITGGANNSWDTGEMTATCEVNSRNGNNPPATPTKPPITAIARLMYGDTLLQTTPLVTEQTQPNDKTLRQQQRCQQHLAEQASCQCGIHAFYTPQRTRDMYGSSGSFLLTQVTLFGQVISDQYGYRASHSRVEAMWLMKDTEKHGPIEPFDEWMAFAFSNKYGGPCTVISLETWNEFVEPLTPPIHPGLGKPWDDTPYGIS